MNPSSDIFSAIFNSFPERIAILNDDGAIQLVNSAWGEYAIENSGTLEQAKIGGNYLDICDASAEAGDGHAQLVSIRLRQLFENRGTPFCFDYLCQDSLEKRWFEIQGRALLHGDNRYSIISHQEVTKTTLLIEKLQKQALSDSLTGLANRRHFDEFLNEEWRRDMRKETPLSMIMLDIDFFKPFNDRYGHVAGDESLRRVASLINSFAKRPGDLAVRYGGEEFILLLGGTPSEAAVQIARKLCASVEDLGIANEDSTVSSSITVSLGVVSMIPRQGMSETVLLPIADQALYTAKNTGRNKVAQSNLRLN